MSAIRAFSNNKRISTGRPMKNGSFFQAYPTHQVFGSQDEWMNVWKSSSNVTFVEEGYEDMPPLIPASTLPRTPTTKNITETKTQDNRALLVEMLRNGVTDIVTEWYRRTELDVPRLPPAAANPTTPPTKTTVPTSPPRLARKSKTKPTMDDWNYTGTKSFVAPAGTYYIGDLCYFLKDPIYDGIFGGHGYESGLYTEKSSGEFFMVDNTSHGDGEYIGTDGFGYGVDAGIIGIASRSLGPESDEKVYGGKLYTFKEPIEIKFQKGLFRFKSHSKYLAIDTSGDIYNSDEDW
jgi:hypothetical protein